MAANSPVGAGGAQGGDPRGAQGGAGGGAGGGQSNIITPIGGVVPDAGAYAISEAKTALPTPVPVPTQPDAGKSPWHADSRPGGGNPLPTHPAEGSGTPTTVGMAPPPKELTPPEEILPTGSLVDGRYEVLATLGRGGMGAVYRARDKVLDEEVAIKILLPGVVNAPGMAERFLIEAKTSLALTHPGIVRVRSFELDPERKTAFIIMALVKGRSLRHVLRERRRFEGKDALDLIARVLDALVVAHKVTIHRDLKPENIMIDESGQPIILDFGLAKAAAKAGGGGGITQSGAVMGTYAYMAPEQGLDSSQVDGRADVYAMGAILYELWTGRIPQGSFPPPSRVRADLPPGSDEVALKALAYLVEERYASAQAMLDAVNGLRALYGNAPVGTGVALPAGAGAGTPNPGVVSQPTASEGNPTAPWWTGDRAPPGGAGGPGGPAGPGGPGGRSGAGSPGGSGGSFRSADTVNEPRPATVAPRSPLASATPVLVVIAVAAALFFLNEWRRGSPGGPGGPGGGPGAGTGTGAGASVAAATPSVKLPARIAAPTPPAPPTQAPAPTSREHFMLAGERAWKKFLADARPFEPNPSQAIVDAWPALEGKHALVHVEELPQDLDYTDAEGVQYSAKDVKGCRILARWAGFLAKERWFRDEIGFYEADHQDVVGELVGVVKRTQQIRDELVTREWPVIEVRWKWVKGRCAYVPSADGRSPQPGGAEGVSSSAAGESLLAGEEEYLAALRAGWSDPKLLAKPAPKQVADAALRAAREGNRPVFEKLWGARPASRSAMESTWTELRRCFRDDGRGDIDLSRTIRDWVVWPEKTFRNYRGETEGLIDVVFTSKTGEQGYKTCTWEMVQEDGSWRLGSIDEFVPLPRSGLVPPSADATPEQVYALFIRAALEDDAEIARRLVLPEKVDVAQAWLKDWQREFRHGMTETPPGLVKKLEGDAVEITSAPKNGRPGGESWPRMMGLRRVGGVWKVEQGYQQ